MPADGKTMRTRMRTAFRAIRKENFRLHEKKRRRVDGMVDMRCLERRGNSRAGSIPVPGTIKSESPSDFWKGCPEAFFFSPDDRSKVTESKFKPIRIGLTLVEDIPKEDASSITNRLMVQWGDVSVCY